jgi:hypothetical protein
MFAICSEILWMKIEDDKYNQISEWECNKSCDNEQLIQQMHYMRAKTMAMVEYQEHTRIQCYRYKVIPVTAKGMIWKMVISVSVEIAQRIIDHSLWEMEMPITA